MMICVHVLVQLFRPRQKIKAICASQNPVLDAQHPEILEEARFWVLTGASRTQRDRISASASTTCQVASDRAAMMALTDGISDAHVTAPVLQKEKLLQMAESYLLAFYCITPCVHCTIINLFFFVSCQLLLCRLLVAAVAKEGPRLRRRLKLPPLDQPRKSPCPWRRNFKV